MLAASHVQHLPGRNVKLQQRYLSHLPSSAGAQQGYSQQGVGPGRPRTHSLNTGSDLPAAGFGGPAAAGGGAIRKPSLPVLGDASPDSEFGGWMEGWAGWYGLGWKRFFLLVPGLCFWRATA